MINKIKSIYAVWKKRNDNKLVRVCSHPRSGTHFLEAFLAKNFYQNKDLFIGEVMWGHWSNRKSRDEGNVYGKLFGTHIFPNQHYRDAQFPMIYIYRDGRAVAYSIWKTENFIHPIHKDISFSDFLRLKLDWEGTPGIKSAEKYTIAEHWSLHVNEWLALAKVNSNILVLRYEDIINNPYQAYLEIHNKFFKKSPLLMSPDDIDVVKKPTGLKPNMAKKDSWKSVFTKEDEAFFLSQVDANLIEDAKVC